jgi:hypothetical protein
MPFADNNNRKLMIIEKLFTILKDGEWHSTIELTDQIKIPIDKIDEFLKFLWKNDIISYSAKTHRIKIKPEWQNIILDEIKS